MSDVRPTDPARLPGHLALVAVQVCFGLFPYFVQLAHVGFEARGIAVWRIAVGSLALGGLALALYGRRALPARRDLPRLALCALLGVVLNQVLAIEGMVRTTVVNAGLLMTLIPVFTFTLAALTRQERFAASRAVGVPVAMAGAVVLLLQGADSPALGERHLAGNLLIATNCLAYAGFLVLSRPLALRYPPLVLIAWVYVLSLWTLPLIGRGASLSPAAGAGELGTAWLGLALILAFPTVLAYALNTFALSRVPASVTAVYIYLQPLVAGAAGIALLGEPVRPAMGVAAALLFTGIALVTRRHRPPRTSVQSTQA